MLTAFWTDVSRRREFCWPIHSLFRYAIPVHFQILHTESFPFLADAVLSSNLGILLRGTAIGNGWMDSKRQYPAYLEYAVKHGIVEEGSDVSIIPHQVVIFLKFMFIQQYKKNKKETDDCVAEMKRMSGPEPIAVKQCESLVRTVLEGKDKKS